MHKPELLNVATKIDNHRISINEKFGNPQVNGYQHKGALLIDDQTYFAKLDDLNPTVKGEWEKRYDVQHSCISEAIVSVLIKNIINKDNFDSAEYDFASFDINGEEKYGTLSKNYLNQDEHEIVLAIGSKYDDHTVLSIEEYAETIHDTNPTTRFNNLIKTFMEKDVPYEHAKQFLLKQAAFDIMTSNTDRLGNPSNFVMAYNNKKSTARLINMDYGRCLPILWTETSESNYDMEWLSDDLKLYSKEIQSKNDSILGTMSKKEALNFLKENGFKPFQIDIEQLKRDLNQLNEIIQNSDAPFKKFAAVKIKSFEYAIQSEAMKEFYTEYKNETSFSIDFNKKIDQPMIQDKTIHINNAPMKATEHNIQPKNSQPYKQSKDNNQLSL